LVVLSSIIIKTTTEKDKKMNELKDRTATALNYGIVEITINGKTEKATTNLKLIPAENHQTISKEERRNHQQIKFYSLSEAKWKTINFSQVNASKIITIQGRTVNATIF
jgi:ATP phosphoribosyltransferase